MKDKRFFFCSVSKVRLSALFLAAFFLFSATSAQAIVGIADHVVISEIQTASVLTGGVNDDFVELYNPTNSAIDLGSWSVQRTTGSGSGLYRKQLAGTIPAHGFYLIVRDNTNTTPELLAKADILASGSSFSLADNNIVYLVSNIENITGSDDTDIVDFVGWGNASFFEDATAPNPVAGTSLERKSADVDVAGEGNAWDTNNNSLDFFVNATPYPQNSSSQLEMPANNEGDEPNEPPVDDEEPNEPPSIGSDLVHGLQRLVKVPHYLFRELDRLPRWLERISR